jgi:hypothetical protein
MGEWNRWERERERGRERDVIIKFYRSIRKKENVNG